MRRWLAAASLLFVAGAVGCSDLTGNPAIPSGSSGPGGPGGPGGSAGLGTLTVRLTDSPFSDATALFVTFSQVRVHRSEFGWETLPFAGGAAERTCDLKRLQGATDVLGVGLLPAGHYTQIRLAVALATIFLENPSANGSPCAAVLAPPAGDNAPVEIPSGDLKLNREFTIASGGATTILLDFDGEQSIKQTGSGNSSGRGRGNGGAGRYIMTPVIGVVSVQ
jgi:hypothetical protein